jgi:hypothetical protein
MMYGTTETTTLINVPLDDNSHEHIPMQQFSGDYGYQSLVMDEPVYRPTTVVSELSSRYRGLTRNQKIALFALAVIVIGTGIGLLSYFLSGQEDAVLPTTTPFLNTTTTSTTTTTTLSPDPRCTQPQVDPECCDAGQWICGPSL